MQIFVNGFLEQAQRHKLQSELIVVEWNPPYDRPQLADALRWRANGEFCSVRIIVVPRRLHLRYSYADRLPLFQMIAKNVGVRRARGHFVLCTNIDMLFSDQLVQFLTSRRLDPRRMYRIDRLDVPATIPTEASVTHQLEFCRRNVIRVNTRWGTFGGREILWLAMLRRFYQRSIATPLRARKKLWGGELRTLRDRASTWIRKVASRPPRETIRWLRYYPFKQKMRLKTMQARRWSATYLRRMRYAVKISGRVVSTFIHRWTDPTTWKGMAYFVVKTIAAKAAMARGWMKKPLHTNACGDFTLIARKRWFELRGYPEWAMFSIHLDSIFCQMAHHAGIREVVLGRRMRAYHVEHASGWSPSEAERLVQRMAALGVPFLDTKQYRIWVEEMDRRKGPIIVNDENWGLAQEQLLETDPLAGWSSGRQSGHPLEGSRA